jgi:hypothetical protein
MEAKWKKKQPRRKWGMTPWRIEDADIERAGKIERKIAKALRAGRVRLSTELEQKLMQAVESFAYKQAHMGPRPAGPELTGVDSQPQ